jgi:rubrerythrin
MAQLSTKELAALEDQLTMEQNVVSKYKMYAKTASDGEIKQKCKSFAQKHQQHFDTLMAQLQG